MKKLIYIVLFMVSLPLLSQGYEFKQIKLDSTNRYGNPSNNYKTIKEFSHSVSAIYSSPKMTVIVRSFALDILYKGKHHVVDDSVFINTRWIGGTKYRNQILFENDTTFYYYSQMGGNLATLIKFDGPKDWSLIYRDTVSSRSPLGIDFDSQKRIWIPFDFSYKIDYIENGKLFTLADTSLSNALKNLDYMSIIPDNGGSFIENDELFYSTYFGMAKYAINTGIRTVVLNDSVNKDYNQKKYKSFKKQIKKNGKVWHLLQDYALIGYDENGFEKIKFADWSFRHSYDSLKSINDYDVASDGSIWLCATLINPDDTTNFTSQCLYHIIDKNTYHSLTKYINKFDYYPYYDSTLKKMIYRAFPSLVTESPEGQIYVGTAQAGILYLGKDPVSVEDTEERDNVFALMKLYPNPTKNKVNAELHCNATFNPELTDVAIYSYSGQLISNIDRFTISHNKSNGTANIEFNANGIPSGYYFLCISVGGEKKMQSIVIE